MDPRKLEKLQRLVVQGMISSEQYWKALEDDMAKHVSVVAVPGKWISSTSSTIMADIKSMHEAIAMGTRISTAAKRAKENGAQIKVFDWSRAATIILENPDVDVFHAGILGDWRATAAPIWYAGEPFPDMKNATTASNYGEPAIQYVNDAGDGVHEPCWVLASSAPRNGGWPREALKTLGL